MSNKKNNAGSSLIEVLVAILIVGLVITGVMLSISYSIKNSAEARYREIASQLAQDGMEVVKLRREVEQWTVFFNYAPATGNRRYCLNPGNVQLALVSPPATCVDNVPNENKRFTRYVDLSRTSGTPQTVRATVTVIWQSDSNQSMDVVVSQEFRERII